MGRIRNRSLTNNNKMNNRIASSSVFGEYSGKENRVTAAFLHILDLGGEPLLRYVLGVANESLPDSEIKIGTQQVTNAAKGKSVFDGVISCDFKFDYIVESKVDNNPLTIDQVNKYHQAYQANHKLFALTSDVTIPNSLHTGDIWLNWTMLVNALKEYNEENENEVLSYLIDQFVLLLNNLQLYDEWENRVIVVGGSFGEDVALNYGFYACQNNRFFRKAKYMAFAYDNHIRNLFEIVGGPFNDIDIQKEKNISQDYFVNKEPFYKSEKRELFWLKKVSILNILNDTTDKNGRRLAFTQRQTYTTYDKITTATVTSEL